MIGQRPSSEDGREWRTRMRDRAFAKGVIEGLIGDLPDSEQKIVYLYLLPI